MKVNRMKYLDLDLPDDCRQGFPQTSGSLDENHLAWVVQAQAKVALVWSDAAKSQPRIIILAIAVAHYTL